MASEKLAVPELLPCPWCGGKGYAKQHTRCGPPMVIDYWCNCEKCLRSGPHGASLQAAVAAWNTRADSERIARLQSERDALREALAEAQEQLEVGRRYLPSHGSFGEEGICAYEYAQNKARAALAGKEPGKEDVTLI